MASVEQYFKEMGVKHEADGCTVCNEIEASEPRTPRFETIIQSGWIIWSLVGLSLLGVYYGFYWFIYFLVGRMY